MRQTLRAIPLIAAVLLVAACSDSPTTPSDKSPTGTMQHTYSGAMTGTFRASGKVSLDALNASKPASYAFALSSAENGSLALYSFEVTGKDVGRATLIAISATTPGTYPLGLEACYYNDSDSCGMLFFADNLSFNDRDDLGGYGDHVAISETGEITITKRSEKRLEGTYAGTLTVYGMDATASNAQVTVTGGKFDLPLFNDNELYWAANRFPAEAQDQIKQFVETHQLR